VPGDIGLIGLNDMEMARWQNINLTTIRQPIAEIIEASIDLVVATIEAPTSPRNAAVPLPGDRTGNAAAGPHAYEV
jgi:DNA-binding LacI/PurR family transcriptional regulator